MHDLRFECCSPAFPGALESLERLYHDDRTTVTFMTALPPNVLYGSREKIQWLAEHLPCIDPVQDLVFAHAKNTVMGHVLCDDTPETLDTFEGTSICLAWPYNRGHGAFRTPEQMDVAERWRWFETACGTLHEMLQAYDALAPATRDSVWDLTILGTRP